MQKIKTLGQKELGKLWKTKWKKLLGVELGEKFNIVMPYFDDEIENPFLLKEDGLYKENGRRCDAWLVDLLAGLCEVEKLPFKPGYNEKYFYPITINGRVGASTFRWADATLDYLLYAMGLVFKIEEEAMETGVPKLKEIMGEYHND